jgi:hypothetical protein
MGRGKRAAKKIWARRKRKGGREKKSFFSIFKRAHKIEFKHKFEFKHIKDNAVACVQQ